MKVGAKDVAARDAKDVAARDARVRRDAEGQEAVGLIKTASPGLPDSSDACDGGGGGGGGVHGDLAR